MSSSISNLLHPLLEQTALADIASPNKQQVCSIEHSMSIADVLRTLARRNILSAPLVAGFDLEDVAEAGMDTAPSLLGWIDIADIVSALIKRMHTYVCAPKPTTLCNVQTSSTSMTRCRPRCWRSWQSWRQRAPPLPRRWQLPSPVARIVASSTRWGWWGWCTWRHTTHTHVATG